MGIIHLKYGGGDTRIATPDARLRAALRDIIDLFEDKQDIVDGPEGAQLPNDAMRACQIAAEALGDAHGG